MGNGAPLKYRELQVLVLFLLIILEMCSSLALECTASLGKNSLKMCKTMRNEEATLKLRKAVKPCDR